MTSDRVPDTTKKPRLIWSTRSSVCAASAFSSTLTLLAFPPFGFWILAFVAPLPLVWAASRIHTQRLGAALAATLGTAPVWTWQAQWVFGVSPPGAILMVLYLSLYAGLFVWLASWLADRLRAPVWLLGPLVWVGLEVLRGQIAWDGFPWLLAGYPIIESPILAHAGAVVGIYGISFFTVALGMAAFGIAAARGRARIVALAMLLGVALAWAALAATPRITTDGLLRVGVIQTNVPQSVKLGWPPPERMRDFDRMLELTVRASRVNPTPDLIVWPETMYPGGALDANSLNEERAAALSWTTDTDTAWPVLRFVITRGADGIDTPVRVSGPFERQSRLMMPTTVVSDSLLAWQERLGIPFLIGAEGFDGYTLEVEEGTGVIAEDSDAWFNSSYLINQGRVEGQRYDKMHLTPFGEVMPYISAWPWLESLFLRVGIGATGLSFDMDAGTTPVTHIVRTESGLVRVATPICFEGIMPEVCRRLAYVGSERQADVLIQLTNEGWFATFDAAREQHLQIIRWRAVELGLPVIRAANTGISALIDPQGRVIVRGAEAGDTRHDGVLWVEAPLPVGTTPFGRVGDIVGWANLAGLGGLLLAGTLLGFIRRGSPQSPTPDGTDEENNK